jgi:flagellar biosynthesis/type III secretory pathway protein FliH
MGGSGHKIIGRYLKKGSQTLAKVKITPYSFEAIPDSGVIYSDNAGKNIIHAGLHEEAELLRAIAIPKELAQELIDPNLQAAIVFPRNFTKDWTEDKKRQKKRGMAHYEDEEEPEQAPEVDSADEESEDRQPVSVDQPVAEEFTTKNLEREMKASAASEFAHGSTDGKRADGQMTGQAGQTNFESFAEMQRPGRITIDDSLSMVGKAIKDLAQLDQRAGKQDLRAPQNEGHDFIPLDVRALQDGDGLEDSAVAEYGRQRMAAQVDVEAIKEKAQAQGYEAGFRIGEERATLQYREKIAALFKNVEGLVSELSGLKRDILEQVQGNFHEISQAMCEALIDRAISLDPTIFADVMQRAISEAVEGDTIKIRVSTRMSGLLSKVEIAEGRASIIADNTLGDDEFRIDSKLGVVDSSIHKIITDLLSQTDLNIFDSLNKAG